MRFRCDAVDVSFGDRAVLQSISLDLNEQRIGIIGDNGSGKSTLARLLNGLVLPTQGCVTVDGLDTRRDGGAIRRQVGFVFQNADAQIVMPTVAEDIGFGLSLRKLSAAESMARVDAVMARFGLGAMADWPCHALSGGEKQLLALASTLVLEPAAVVFDEPTTMLDRRRAAALMETIKTLTCQVIVVTHHTELLEGFDRVVLLEQGRVAADGRPTDVIARYQTALPV